MADVALPPPDAPPFFVAGCPRSGTTLAARILDGHSRMAVYLESNYYVTFHRMRRFYGELEDPADRRRFVADVVAKIRVQRTQPPAPEEIEEALVAPTFEGVLATFLRLYARDQGKARGADKTPLHFRFIDDIHGGFPDSPPMIYLVRDPRDVVVSMRKAWGSDLDQATQVWNEAFLAQMDAPSGALHVVHYEDLVRDPVPVVRSICGVLGEDFEVAMLEPSGQPPEALRGIRHLDLGMLSGPVTATSVGNFRDLPADEVRRIELACAMGMDALGYEFTARPAPPLRPPMVRSPGPVRHVTERLRYFGLNRERWRRALFDLRLLVVAAARHLLRRTGLLPGARG